MRANIYVDGFNLFYGSMKGNGPGYKWLDLAALGARLLPKDTVNRIRYFTARVNARPGDPQQPQRQQTYLRALGTIPSLSIHSDLAEPIALAQSRLGITVGVVNPHPAKYRSLELKGTFFKQLRGSAVKGCQFPDQLVDAQGSFRKPHRW